MQYFPRPISTPVKPPSPHGATTDFDGGIYAELMARTGEGDAFDRHVLASAIVHATTDDTRALTVALGLDSPVLTELLETCFSGWRRILGPNAAAGDAGEPEIEEEDFRALLLAHRSSGARIEEWLAHIIVRRSLCPDHLWRNLGVRSRKELSETLFRHFRALAEQNVRDMRWKKFFYREMCKTEGILICKSPVCDTCPDFAECFGPEL